MITTDFGIFINNYNQNKKIIDNHNHWHIASGNNLNYSDGLKNNSIYIYAEEENRRKSILNTFILEAKKRRYYISF